MHNSHGSRSFSMFVHFLEKQSKKNSKFSHHNFVSMHVLLVYFQLAMAHVRPLFTPSGSTSKRTNYKIPKNENSSIAMHIYNRFVVELFDDLIILIFTNLDFRLFTNSFLGFAKSIEQIDSSIRTDYHQSHTQVNP